MSDTEHSRTEALIESLGARVRKLEAALLSIACMDEGPEVWGKFDEPCSAQAARNALAADFIGPCMHGRDPYDRCEEAECMTQESAWAHAFCATHGAKR